MKANYVFNLLKRVGFAVLLLGVTNGHSQSWELMDELPEHSLVFCIMADAQSGRVFAGSSRIFGFPECGGIYRYDPTGEAWELMGFVGVSVTQILRLPNDHTYIYACTEEGLARSNDDGETWQLFGTQPGKASYMSMSPHDSTLWAVGITRVESEKLYFVQNGAEWEVMDSLLPRIRGMEFSRRDTIHLYMATNNICYRFNIQTRERENLFQYWNFYGYRTLYSCQMAPLIYVLELHSIFSFNEETSLYDSIFFPAGSGRANRWAISSSETITVAADSMLLEVSSDLSSVNILTPPESGLGGSTIGIDTVSGVRYVAVENRIYVEILETTTTPSDIPIDFAVSIYPNPFNNTANIAFDLPREVTGKLVVYDMLGRMTNTLYDGKLSAGSHQMQFNGNGLSSGTYFVRFETPAFTATQKAVLLK
jgi:hypothetical protein